MHRSKACIYLPHVNKFRNLISNQHYLPTRNMKIDWHTCSCTVALHTQRYVILSLTNEEVKRHTKVTTLSNSSDSEDLLYFPSLTSIVILIHSPPMTVKKKKSSWDYICQLKMARRENKNLPLLSSKGVKLNSNLQTLAVFVSDPSSLATLQVKLASSQTCEISRVCLSQTCSVTNLLHGVQV